ncbi:MAG: alpha/beta hydrolase [Pseudomonadota bacterium]
MRTSWSFTLILPMTLLLSLVAKATPSNLTEPSSDSCFIDGVQEQLICGYVPVPENYQQPDAKQIKIHYAILPAISEGAKPDPLLILAGGPGQAATELAPMISRIFDAVRKQRDIVLIDQRGAGKSNPLECDISHADELIQSDEEQDLTETARQCLAKFSDTDTLQYSTHNSIRDFERVRKELGVEQFNLYGGSYGSRAALKYLQLYPDSVRTATLDAVAPPQVVIGPFGLHGSLAFDQLLEDCQQQVACKEAFATLGDDYQKVMSRLDNEQVILDTTDPLSEQPLTIRLTPGRFSSIIRMALYSPMTRQLLPYAISSAAKDNFKPILGLMGGTTIAAQNSIYLGLMLSVVCSEDLPRATDSLFQQDADNDFIGGRTGEAFQALCAGWQSKPVAEGWDEPVESEKPVLLLSGTEDPVTPPRWGDIAARTLPNSRHIVAEHASHTIASHTCANTLIADFIEQGTVQQLNAECLEDRIPQPFVVNVNGEGL